MNPVVEHLCTATQEPEPPKDVASAVVVDAASAREWLGRPPASL
jgi:hypothetical protein